MLTGLDTGQHCEMRGSADKPLRSDLTGAKHCDHILVMLSMKPDLNDHLIYP